MTSSLQGEEKPILDPDGLKWLPKANCFCIDHRHLAKAANALEFAKIKLTLKDEEFQRRLEAMKTGADLKLKLTQGHCLDQLEITKNSCAAQLNIVLEQSSSLVSDITTSYAKRLKTVSGLLVPQKTPWYKHPTLWGIVGGIGGTALGVGIGAMLWK
jgi:hypothetical protein